MCPPTTEIDTKTPILTPCTVCEELYGLTIQKLGSYNRNTIVRLKDNLPNAQVLLDIVVKPDSVMGF